MAELTVGKIQARSRIAREPFDWLLISVHKKPMTAPRASLIMQLSLKMSSVGGRVNLLRRVPFLLSSLFAASIHVPCFPWYCFLNLNGLNNTYPAPCRLVLPQWATDLTLYNVGYSSAFQRPSDFCSARVRRLSSPVQLQHAVLRCSTRPTFKSGHRCFHPLNRQSNLL